MSPEQLEGKDADARSDIFAFGCVLYEMATGKKAFSGASQASLISSIMKEEPAPISAVAPMAPTALDRVVRRCLAKDPEDRWQNAADLRSELKWIAEGGSQTGIAAPVVAPARRGQSWAPWAVALLLALLGFFAGRLLRAPSAPLPVLRSAINLPPKTSLDRFNTSIALSPDGRRLAFAASAADGRKGLWVRSMDGMEIQLLAGTEGAVCPFWSPDSSSIGFFADHKLKKVPAGGGMVLAICDAADGRGASWSAGDVIVFAPAPFGGLWRVPASGGAPTALTEIKGPGATHRLPWFLPDGKHVLFLSGVSRMDSKENAIWALDIDSKKSWLVAAENSEGRYVAPGYLMFVRDGNLMAQPLDLASIKTTGEAVPVAEKVQYVPVRWSGNFAFSNNGLLVFQTGSPGQKGELTWFDADGKSLGTVGEPAAFQKLVLSPDEHRLAAAEFASTGAFKLSVWLCDLVRGVSNPFSFGNVPTFYPVWSPDGRQVAYGNSEGAIFVKPADGASEPKTIATDLPNPFLSSWSPDGRFIAARIQDLKAGGLDIWIIPVDGREKPHPFIATGADEREGAFSPDGKWFSYLSDESGRRELYVVPFPGPGEKRQISTGGAEPEGNFWIGDGRQIVYAQSPERKLVAVDLEVQGSSLGVGGSHPLFNGKLMPDAPFTVTRDGKKLLLAVPTDERAATQLTLVTNWAAELKKK